MIELLRYFRTNLQKLEYIIIGDYCNDDTKEMISKINDKRIILI